MTTMRAVLAFIALPGMVAYAVPALLAAAQRGAGLAWFGLVPLLLGTAALLWCTLEFHRRCRGTLAPWSPPVDLVTSGAYRYSRNPMYLAVLLVLFGWALTFRSGQHAAYVAAVAIGFHLRVVLGEEPQLARGFSTEWSTYKAEVPRWLPPARRWPWSLWLGTGALFGAALWLLSPAFLGRNEPWADDGLAWTMSWPVVGALGAAARHPRGLCLPLGHALGQCAVIWQALAFDQFRSIAWMFMGGGLAVGLALNLTLLGLLALWQRARSWLAAKDPHR
jgi:protein-S-isoprenylcysteine O-methyltransferase Ste14